MVFKKPYGILIKHFKLIHVFITILMAYLIYKMTHLISFFNEYVSLGWRSVTESEISSYINPLMYISIFLILLLCIIIYLLMRFKNKPRLYYLLTPILYLGLFIVLIVVSSTLNDALLDVISPIKSRAIRDVLLIVTGLQFVLIVFSLLRAIGFDVKKFNFRQDIADLEISELDSEEVEVNFEVKKYKIKRNLKRRLRNIKYIFLEHKFIWTLAIVVVVLLVGGFTAYNMFVVNKSYRQNTVVSLGNYSISVTNSALVINDYKDNEISDKYKYFVVNVNIINRIENNAFALNNISLEMNGKIYSTIETGYSNFIDFGYEYKEGRNLSVDKPNKYIFVFRIPKEERASNAYLRYLYKTEYKNGNPVTEYKKIKLNFSNYENSINYIEKKINESLEFNNNSIKINSIEFNERFTYEYDFCTSEDNCTKSTGYIIPTSSNNTTILKLGIDAKFDESDPITDIENYGDFLENYASIKYTVGDKTYLQRNIINLTPDNFSKNEVYLNVSKNVEKADTIKIEFKNYGKKYSYTIKE